MPDGRDNTVELLVATIPALLVMKGYAITGRDNDKDAYGYLLFDQAIRNRAFTGLAADCLTLIGTEEARKGYEKLASKFCSSADFGPQTVRKFCVEQGAFGGMTPEQIQQDAFGQVVAFISNLGL